MDFMDTCNWRTQDHKSTLSTAFKTDVACGTWEQRSVYWSGWICQWCKFGQDCMFLRTMEDGKTWNIWKTYGNLFGNSKPCSDCQSKSDYLSIWLESDLNDCPHCVSQLLRYDLCTPSGSFILLNICIGNTACNVDVADALYYITSN